MVALIPCWSCKGPVDGVAPFCATCGAVQPPGGADHFTRMDLPQHFALDVTSLERSYFDLQRRLHPDRFATRTAAERSLSQQQAVALNEAYETLKDPLRRAAYLLRLSGEVVAVDEARTVSDPALLMEAMEMREALEEAADGLALARFQKDATAQVNDCVQTLTAAFAAHDLALAGRLTTRLKYLTKLVEEAKARRLRLLRQGR